MGRLREVKQGRFEVVEIIFVPVLVPVPVLGPPCSFLFPVLIWGCMVLWSFSVRTFFS